MVVHFATFLSGLEDVMSGESYFDDIGLDDGGDGGCDARGLC